jgi:uncharacterized protein YndB with AHSA1/START domain
MEAERQNRFVYVTYIATTREKLWEALTNPEFTKRYWFGVRQESDWAVGSSWQLRAPDGRLVDTGEVLEIEPPSKIVVSWRNELHADMRAIGFTRATFLLEPLDDTIRLTITHDVPAGGDSFFEGISGGWPYILSSLKSMLETGQALPGTDKWPS